MQTSSPVFVELPADARAICRERLEDALLQNWDPLASTLSIANLRRIYLRLRDAELNGTFRAEINSALSTMAGAGPILLPYPCAPVLQRLSSTPAEMPSSPTDIADWMAIAGRATKTGIPFPRPPLVRSIASRPGETSPLPPG